MKIFTTFATSAALLCLASPAAAATFLGSTVRQTTTLARGKTLTAFATAAVVGSGVEFTGKIKPILFKYDVIADFDATGLTFRTGPVDGFQSTTSSSPLATFVFTFDRDVFAGVDRAFSTCVTTDRDCKDVKDDYRYSVGAASLTLELEALVQGVDYRFDFTAPRPAAPVAPAVPEPAGWAMMILGLGTVGYALRSRKQRYSIV